MSPVEFEPTIPASERPQNNALDRDASGDKQTNKQTNTSLEIKLQYFE
jgi:hypothetical protein